MKSQFAQLQKKQTLLRIFIFTLVTIIVWVGLSLFRTQQRTGISPELIKMSESLNPNINSDVIDQIEAKREFTTEELSDFPIYSIITTKNGDQQLVVFSASDKARKEAVLNAPAGSPGAAGPEGTPTAGGNTITVQSGNRGPSRNPEPTEAPLELPPGVTAPSAAQ